MKIFPAFLAIVGVLCLASFGNAQCGCQAPAQLSFGQQNFQSFGAFAAPAPLIVQQPVFAAPVILAPRRFGFGFGGGVNIGVGFGRGGFGRNTVFVGGGRGGFGRTSVFVGGGRGFGRTIIR